MLPNPKHKKVLSATAMGIYQYLFNNDNHDEILNYCNERLGNWKNTTTPTERFSWIPCLPII